ncbi:MAG: elongation factor G [Clostridia bacterium]|nr:elongation factor G [Clostridia bacterium]
MKQYPVEKLRNVAVMGHGGDGKSSLIEHILFHTKAIDRLGKIADGNTTSDFDPEEIKRTISISTSILPVEHDGYKINFLDTPGYFDFVGEVAEGVRVSDAALIVLSAKSGVEVGTRKAYKLAVKNNLPTMFVVNKMDEENADFYASLDSLRDNFGVKVCPISIPIIENEKFVGVVDCIRMKARRFEGGKVIDIDIPDSMQEHIEPVRNMLMESVAESSDELMEKFFDGEEFTADEIDNALKNGVREASILPVLCSSAVTGGGIPSLLANIESYFPSPAESKPEIALDAKDEEVEVPANAADPASALVFKTVADPFVGKLSYFKVMSGTVKANSELYNTRAGASEKIGRIFFVRGKKQVETTEVGLGDIGAVTKLGKTVTGDTLCASSRQIKFEGIDFPKPSLSLAIVPKAKGDEEKIASGLTRLSEEDSTFSTYNNPETRQLVISGVGDVQLDVIISKLKSKFGVEAELIEPRVAYRETIRKTAEAEGKHKKQSGGAGQFGVVQIRFEPITDGSSDFEFVNAIVGGVVPKEFIPAVEKGLRESMQHGVLAGYPMVGVKATLFDGKYHPVDSKEVAFKSAARLSYKAACAQASPVLLEPIGKAEVHIPDDYMGDVIGDMNKRRGQILGMDKDADGMSVVSAYVPMSEMHTYAIDLRSMTRGQGDFTIEFDRYEQVPDSAAQKIIADAKFVDEEE